MRCGINMKDGKMEEVKKENCYYKWNDGWFTYYVNVATGKKKFILEDSDIEVSHKMDDSMYKGDVYDD